MNKIAIVGHPTSGHEEVQELLHRCGMARALPSRREGLLPQDIITTLSKVHNAPPLDNVSDEGALNQIEAGPVWQSMVLDLMLGNQDQPLWGWADPQTIHVLDDWAKLDPELTFVLVYDEPQRVLLDAARKASEGGGIPSEKKLRRLLDSWASYNGALLGFHLRHAGRSLLVHGRQVRRTTDRFVEQLQPMLDVPLVMPEPEKIEDPQGGDQDETAPAVVDIAVVQPALPAALSQAVAKTGVASQEAAALFNAEAVGRYLADAVLNSHTRALHLYAELQSAANLPLDRGAQAAAAGDPALAWVALARQRAFVTRLTAEIGEENELLLAQLHHVQEELERVRLENERPKGPTGAAERIKGQLTYRLGSVMVERSHSLKGWIGMAPALLAEAKAFRKDEKARKGQKLPPIEEYIDAHEAERVKEHLSYKLGQVILRHGKTPWGWLILPFAIVRARREFKRQKKDKGTD